MNASSIFISNTAPFAKFNNLLLILMKNFANFEVSNKFKVPVRRSPSQVPGRVPAVEKH